MANQITVDIVADTRQLVAGVKTTNQQLNSLQGSIGKIKTAFGGLASAFGFQVGAGFLKDAIKGAADEEATFASLAELYGKDAKKITDSINSLSKGLKVDDGAIAQYYLDLAASTDVRFKPFYQDIVTQSVRLATVLKQPPSEFISAWTKALKDGKLTADEIAKTGIDLNEEQKKTFNSMKTTAEKVTYVLGLAREQSKNAEDLVSPWQKLDFAMGELKDRIGAALLPALTGLLNFYDKLSPAQQKVVDTVVAFAVGIAALAATFAPVLFVLKELGLSFGVLKTAMMAAVTGLRALAVAAFTNPFTPIIIGIAALVVGIVLLVKNWDTVKAAFEKGVEAIKNAFNAVISWFGKVGTSIKNAIGNLFETGKQFGVDIINGLVQGIKNMALAPINAIKSVVSGVTNAIKSVLKIGSPSKVFAGFGKNIVEGLSNGIDGAQKLAAESMAGLSGGLTLAPSTGTGRGAVNITINAGLGTDAYELGRAVRAALNKYDGVNGR